MGNLERRGCSETNKDTEGGAEEVGCRLFMMDPKDRKGARWGETTSSSRQRLSRLFRTV